MLVLSRRIGEKIKIGDDITVIVVDVEHNKVLIGIEAPKDIPVHREEVALAIKKRESDHEGR